MDWRQSNPLRAPSAWMPFWVARSAGSSGAAKLEGADRREARLRTEKTQTNVILISRISQITHVAALDLSCTLTAHLLHSNFMSLCVMMPVGVCDKNTPRMLAARNFTRRPRIACEAPDANLPTPPSRGVSFFSRTLKADRRRRPKTQASA